MRCRISRKSEKGRILLNVFPQVSEQFFRDERCRVVSVVVVRIDGGERFVVFLVNSRIEIPVVVVQVVRAVESAVGAGSIGTGNVPFSAVVGPITDGLQIVGNQSRSLRQFALGNVDLMRIDILTLFPDVVGDMLCESILGRGQERGFIRIECHQIRDYTTNKQKQVDDYPYGGGRGCVMLAQPLYDCWKKVLDDAGHHIHTIFMSPCGKVFCQDDARRLQREHDRLIIVCGRYEGVDERFVEECVDEEISIGDFVLTGGEIPAMVLADAVCRLVPGVLPDEECFTDESHWDGLLEYPQYTRPEVWRERHVPEVLLSGHHENIRKWRRQQSLQKTRDRRPDMYEKLDLPD